MSAALENRRYRGSASTMNAKTPEISNLSLCPPPAADGAASGAYSYAAERAGTFYFGCKVAGHCASGQKLTLTVTGMFCVWAN